MKLLRKLKCYLRLREAVRRADAAHERDGHRYYVIPGFGSDRGRLLIVDRKSFRVMRDKHYFSAAATVFDLGRGAFYVTPHRDGSGAMDSGLRRARARAYFRYNGA